MKKKLSLLVIFPFILMAQNKKHSIGFSIFPIYQMPVYYQYQFKNNYLQISYARSMFPNVDNKATWYGLQYKRNIYKELSCGLDLTHREFFNYDDDDFTRHEIIKSINLVAVYTIYFDTKKRFYFEFLGGIGIRNIFYDIYGENVIPLRYSKNKLNLRFLPSIGFSF